jgi:hypothetical protein
MENEETVLGWLSAQGFGRLAWPSGQFNLAGPAARRAGRAHGWSPRPGHARWRVAGRGGMRRLVEHGRE